MGIFEQFPYTNFHELNLDWILKALKELEHTIEQFVAINALKYADPIQWNITSQYEKNTIVIDPVTGVAYISVQPVPAGVALTNTDYWTVVFDLGSFVVKAAKNFTSNYEEATTLTATMPLNAGDWVIWGDTLYKALVNITAGDSYVVDGNIKQFTMEDVIGHLEDLSTTDKSNLVAAINEVLQALVDTAGDLDNLTTTDKSNLVAAINEVLSTLTTALNNAVAEIEAAPRANTIGLDYLATTMSYDARYPAYSGNRYNAVGQGMCINDDDELVLVRVDEAARDNYGIIEIYNVNGNLLSQSPSLEVGHGNTITYADGYYYVGWSLSASGGVTSPSYNVSKIKKDFSTTEIITAPIIIPSVSYDEESDTFYCFNGGKIYNLSKDLQTVISTVQSDETPSFNTTLHPNMERQNGVKYGKYWMQLYVFPPLMAVYEIETGKLVKQYNFPRRLKYNGFSTYEPESIVYDPDTDFFYSNFFSRCGAGDISSNVFCRWSPFKNSLDSDDRYFSRNGVGLDLYVDPTIADNGYMNGKSATPFKYIQNALDYCKAFTDTVFQVHVRAANQDLGAININNTNNFNILLDTGYTQDTAVTIPSITIMKSNNVAIFNMNSDSMSVQNMSNLQIAGVKITDKIYLNRVFDADLQTSSCDELELRNSGVSIYSMTYNTLTKTGEVAFKQENISYLDGGFFTSASCPAGSYIDETITFNRPSNGTPFVVVTPHINTTNMDILTKMHVAVQSRTATGATIRISNEDAAAHNMGVYWLAFTKLS